MINSAYKTFGLMVIMAFTACLASNNDKAEAAKTGPDSSTSSGIAAVDSNEVSKLVLTNLYIKAIEDYMDAVHHKDKTVFDTLFLIKRQNGLPDDFPDIQLPPTVKETKISLLTQQEAGNHKSFFRVNAPAINLIGFVEKDKATFTFVAFYPEFHHQFDAYLDYRFNSTKKDYELEQLTIEVLIYNQEGKPDYFAIYKNGKHFGNRPVK